MGLFNLFKKGNNLPELKDLVWKNQAGKFEGGLNFILKYPQALCICWFSETQNTFNKFLSTKNGTNIEVKMARTVQPFMVEGKTVFFLEHYPLRTEEEKLVQLWNVKEIFVLSALDEPLFEQFGGNNIINLMDRLGMKEDEYIEHSMIGKSIKNAQTKLQQKVNLESTANSSRDWFRINIG
jgi:hypothetical protein